MSDAHHELVSAVKSLALELGRTPSRDEFVSRFGSRRTLESAFGCYSTFLIAAGLETKSRGAAPKVTRELLFGADIEQVVSSHEQKIIHATPKDFRPMLLVGDTHFPFAHQPTLEWIYRFAEKEKPEYIVQMGDLQDQFSHSRFPASRNYYKPDEEMDLGRKQSLTFWDELRRACPDAKCYQITGNHDLRALKSVLQSAPSLEGLVRKSLTNLYEFEGVTTIHDYREELVLQGIMLHHGYMSQLGRQRDFVMQDLATAHTHKGGVLYRPLKDRIITHLDCGYTGDAESKAMSYTPQKTSSWTLGLGFWDEYGARFIPR